MYFIKDVEDSKIIPGVKKLSLDTYSDFRGDIWTVYTDCDFLPRFVEDKISISKYKVLRGLHGDSYNDKLIYCLQGKLELVVVNFDQNSPQYLQKVQLQMDDESNFAVFVPKNFLNGHYCLSETCLFYYKWSESYINPTNQFSVLWSDGELNIDWSLLEEAPILSERDKNAKTIKEKQ